MKIPSADGMDSLTKRLRPHTRLSRMKKFGAVQYACTRRISFWPVTSRGAGGRQTAAHRRRMVIGRRAGGIFPKEIEFMNDTPTPRTDSQYKAHIFDSGLPSFTAVNIDFARQLERELAAICHAAAPERIKALSAALQDCINLFNDADKSPDHKSLICTLDRRETWEAVLRRHGAA